MSIPASPRPWRTERFGGDQPCCLADADGNPVCVQYGSADAALIVDAVNNYAEAASLRSTVQMIIGAVYADRHRARPALL